MVRSIILEQEERIQKNSNCCPQRPESIRTARELARLIIDACVKELKFTSESFLRNRLTDDEQNEVRKIIQDRERWEAEREAMLKPKADKKEPIKLKRPFPKPDGERPANRKRVGHLERSVGQTRIVLKCNAASPGYEFDELKLITKKVAKATQKRVRRSFSKKFTVKEMLQKEIKLKKLVKSQKDEAVAFKKLTGKKKVQSKLKW